MSASWNQMTTDEKLDWLRVRLQAVADSISHVNNSLTGSVNQANANLEKMIKGLAAEVEELKKREG